MDYKDLFNELKGFVSRANELMAESNKDVQEIENIVLNINNSQIEELKETIVNIKQAINAKGVEINDNTPFYQLPEKIRLIVTEQNGEQGGGEGGDNNSSTGNFVIDTGSFTFQNEGEPPLDGRTVDLTGIYEEIETNVYKRTTSPYLMITKKYIEDCVDLWDLEDGWYWRITDEIPDGEEEVWTIDSGYFISKTTEDSSLLTDTFNWFPFHGYMCDAYENITYHIENNSSGNDNPTTPENPENPELPSNPDIPENAIENYPSYEVYGCSEQSANGLYYLVDKYDYCEEGSEINYYCPKYKNINGYELKVEMIGDFGGVSLETSLYVITKNDVVYAVTDFIWGSQEEYVDSREEMLKLGYPYSYAYSEDDARANGNMESYEEEYCSIKIAKKTAYSAGNGNEEFDTSGKYYYIGTHLIKNDTNDFYSEMYTNGKVYLWYDGVGLCYTITKEDPRNFENINDPDENESLWEHSTILDNGLGWGTDNECFFLEGISTATEEYGRRFEDDTEIHLY